MASPVNYTFGAISSIVEKNKLWAQQDVPSSVADAILAILDSAFGTDAYTADGNPDFGLNPIYGIIYPQPNYIVKVEYFTMKGLQPSSYGDGYKVWENGQTTTDVDGNVVDIELGEGVVKVKMIDNYIPDPANTLTLNEEYNSWLDNVVVVEVFMSPNYPIGTNNTITKIDIDGDAQIGLEFYLDFTPNELNLIVEMTKGADSNCTIQTHITSGNPTSFSVPWGTPTINQNVNPWVGSVKFERFPTETEDGVINFWTSIAPQNEIGLNNDSYGSRFFALPESWINGNNGQSGTQSSWQSGSVDDSIVYWFRIIPNEGYSVCMYNFDVDVFNQSSSNPPNVRYNNQIHFKGEQNNLHACEESFNQIVNNYSIEALYNSAGGDAFTGSTCQLDTYWPWWNYLNGDSGSGILNPPQEWRFGAKCFKNVMVDWGNMSAYTQAQSIPWGSFFYGALGNHPFGDVILIDKHRVLTLQASGLNMYNQFVEGIADGSITPLDFDNNEVIIGISGVYGLGSMTGNNAGLLDVKFKINGEAMSMNDTEETIPFWLDFEI